MNIRYIVLSAAIFMLFAHFIACGAQFYQVSMEHDVDAKKESAESQRIESPIFGIHSPGGWNQLPVKLSVGSDLDDSQIKGLKAALKTWEKVVGKQLFDYRGKEPKVGKNFKDLYSSLQDIVNSNYVRENWSATGKPQTVLATTIWNNNANGKIDASDIHFNTQWYRIGDSMTLRADATKEVVDMESLALHEVGHQMGLTHVQAKDDQYSVMNPSLFIGEGLSFRTVSLGDIERMWKIYGCHHEDKAKCDAKRLHEALEAEHGSNKT